MERDYVQRRNPPPSPRSRRYGGRNNRRKSGPPPFLYLALILIIVIVVVVLIVVFVGKGNSGQKPDDTSRTSSASAFNSSSQASGTSSPASEPVSSAPASAAPAPAKDPEGTPEKLDALLKVGDTGYEYYSFVQDYAQQYITTVCDGATQLTNATLYNIVIPTSMDVMLSEEYIESQSITSSNQKSAIDWIYSSINAINPQVKTVSIFDALKLHNSEYIYFRTDHHWTQLGAYYAYKEFCTAKGITAVPLDQFDKKEYSGFLGSFYRDEPNTDMEGNPDTVEAYHPRANTSLYCPYTTEGDTLEGWPVIQDGTDYSAENKYLIFAAGDQPYEEITNADLTDNSACMVVKESFGNAFIPFLVNHYQTVYVVDYRYYDGDISELAAEKGVSDVLLLNNISMTRNEDLIEDLSNRF